MSPTDMEKNHLYYPINVLFAYRFLIRPSYYLHIPAVSFLHGGDYDRKNSIDVLVDSLSLHGYFGDYIAAALVMSEP
jgi:hypothetical protein